MVRLRFQSRRCVAVRLGSHGLTGSEINVDLSASMRRHYNSRATRFPLTRQSLAGRPTGSCRSQALIMEFIKNTLVWCSNRFNDKPRETNIFVADWVD